LLLPEKGICNGFATEIPDIALALADIARSRRLLQMAFEVSYILKVGLSN
jgi:hypothetical protein